jgi:hypothetical protein
MKNELLDIASKAAKVNADNKEEQCLYTELVFRLAGENLIRVTVPKIKFQRTGGFGRSAPVLLKRLSEKCPRLKKFHFHSKMDLDKKYGRPTSSLRRLVRFSNLQVLRAPKFLCGNVGLIKIAKNIPQLKCVIV